MKVCLVIIAKNESHVIGRAIESAKNFVDYVCVSDTGSTPDEFNGMMDAIEAAWGKPYALDIFEWKNFAHNRTQALRFAEDTYPDADYLFMMDADDYIRQLTYINDLTWQEPPPGFRVNVVSDNIEYPRVQIFKAGMGWHFRGVVHEYPECAGVTTELPFYPLTVCSTREGDRNRDPEKYLKDAHLLMTALNKNDADDVDQDLVPRYTFYLAQSFEAAGDLKRAANWYTERVRIKDKGYTEEAYVSMIRLARIALKQPMTACQLEFIVDLCREAQKLCPWRKEAAHIAVCLLNDAKRYTEAVKFYRDNPVFKNVPQGLFIEGEIYRWQYLEQAGISAHYAGLHRTSVILFAKALAGFSDLPLDAARILNNMEYSLDKL
jgi:glycosyltransferase involved in cell wall biosynthesis